MNRSIRITGPFSLEMTCAPVSWGRGRWPSEDWIDGVLIWVGWELDRAVFRKARSTQNGVLLHIDGTADSSGDYSWAVATLGIEQRMPLLSDAVLERIAVQFPGMRPHASGSLFSGLVDSIVGQSISVQAAAMVSARLASYFHPGIELAGRIFWPPPRAVDLSNADVSRLRRTGLTWKRAEALIEAGKAFETGYVPETTAVEMDELRTRLRALRLVGPWTAESTLLWGIGADDAYPTGDVALLRAARLAYGEAGMTMRQLDERSSGWAGHRSWAARLLWLNLFGPASNDATDDR